MQSKYKVVVGSLIGAVAIHMAFVACGRVGNLQEAIEGGEVADGGGESGIFDAIVDTISSIIDGTTKDAMADVDGGSTGGDSGGGSCGSVPARSCGASAPRRSAPARS
jgi:hypothetical protein